MPIHETDLAEERWNQAEWNRYELWEKIEVRLRKKRRLWVAGALAAFLLLSSIPIVRENSPRWAALRATRRLAQEINRLKRDAALMNQAYRLRMRGNGVPIYDIEQLTRCSAGAGVMIRSGSLQDRDLVPLAVLGHETGATLNVPGLSETFCFDPLTGHDSASVTGFALVPASDLESKRDDRLAVLLISGTSAEISYD